MDRSHDSLLVCLTNNAGSVCVPDCTLCRSEISSQSIHDKH